MSFIYQNHEQLVIEIKKLLLESKTTQREVAAALGIKPQGLVNLLSKKNFGFDDAARILSVLGYDMQIDFVKSQYDTK